MRMMPCCDDWQGVLKVDVEAANLPAEPQSVRVPLKTIDGIVVLQPNL